MRTLRLVFQPRDPAAIELTYLGRNGTGKCTGIEVMSLGQGIHERLMLSPINSKGCVAQRCNIDLPADPSLLREVGTYFLELARETETTRTSQGE
jgi:hypothetical protein